MIDAFHTATTLTLAFAGKQQLFILDLAIVSNKLCIVITWILHAPVVEYCGHRNEELPCGSTRLSKVPSSSFVLF